MRLIRSKDTGLEQSVKRLLRSAHVRYRSHPNLYGKPDFRVAGVKVVIFSDSSFWHGRADSGRHGFKKNKAFWRAKMEYNKARDKVVTKVLKEAGWTVVRLWDTDIMQSPERAIGAIRRAVNRARSQAT